MKKYFIQFLGLIIFTQVALAQEIAPATIEDIESFDKQISEVKHHVSKEDKSEKKVVKEKKLDKILIKEARKMEKDLEKRNKQEAKHALKEQRKADDKQEKHYSNMGKGNGRDDAQRQHKKKRKHDD